MLFVDQQLHVYWNPHAKLKKQHKQVTKFYMKNVKQEQTTTVLYSSFAYLRPKRQKATAGEKKEAYILQNPLGKRSWSRAVHAPAHLHARTKRNDFPVGAAALSPSQPPIHHDNDL